jgi:deazaflavin-dependent oxidoreductase (nitroreductase family)
MAGRALLLTTTGRRSGEPRTCALIYLKDGERLVVVASNGGSDHPPSWLLNLQADPDVGVQIGRKKFSARASVASAAERERLWPRVNRHNMGLAPIMHPGARGRYDVYQRHTTRLIALVLLERSPKPCGCRCNELQCIACPTARIAALVSSRCPQADGQLGWSSRVGPVLVRSGCGCREGHVLRRSVDPQTVVRGERKGPVFVLPPEAEVEDQVD